jgi:kinesin family protein 4/21/27
MCFFAVEKLQVQIGTHSFTFDHVYGSSGTPAAAMFDECVAPLVEGLFQGYNATVLAYGQVNHSFSFALPVPVPCAIHSFI